MYWRKVGKNPDKYEVVDGQQRLRTIFEFMDGSFDLGKKTDTFDQNRTQKSKYKDKDKKQNHSRRPKTFFWYVYSWRNRIKMETDDEEVREMFLRLQNGTTLKAQKEK